jgi:hypothetical protein
LEANPFDFPAAKSCHLQRVKTTGFRTAIDFRRDGPDSQFGKRRDSATRYHYFGSLRSFHHDSYELNIQVFLEKSAIAEIAELIFAHFVAKIAPCAEILVHRLVAQ